LGWAPKTFWKATISEFFMAIEGHNRIESGSSGPPPLTRAEFEALEAEYL
jgi:hypothetical protein